MVFSSFSTCWKSTKARQPLATGHCSFGAQCSSPSVSKGSFRKEQFRIKHHQIIPLPLRKMHTSNIKHHYGNHWFIKHHPNIMEFIASSVPISEKSSPVLEINPLGRWRLRTGVFPWYPARGIPKKNGWFDAPFVLVKSPMAVLGSLISIRSYPLVMTNSSPWYRWLIYRGLPIKNSDFPWLC